MPYIDKQGRNKLDFEYPTNAGELNYCITKQIDLYLGQKGLKYTNINEVIGVLECAKLELYRRIAIPYEDIKIKENGDVYDSKLTN